MATTAQSSNLPKFSGFGLGMRRPHFAAFVEGSVPVDFVEVISENFLVDGGRPLRILESVREQYPVMLHGVSMSLGSHGGLRPDYMRRLKALADRFEPLWVSDHLSWSGVAGFNSHDLLPLPLNPWVLDIVCANIEAAQDVLARPLVVENPSTYVTFADDEMPEWEFISAIADRTGCSLLLDINNIFVSGCNNGFDPYRYIDEIPPQHVVQIHLAGHSRGPHCLIDTHDAAVCDEVWDLYRHAMRRLGPVATMVERDDNIPPIGELLDELDQARKLACEGLSR